MPFEFLHIRSYSLKGGRDVRTRHMTSISPEIRSPSQTRCIIFDLDGTLVHSAVDFTRLKSETIRLLGDLGLSIAGLSERMKTYQIMAKMEEQIKKGESCLPFEEISRQVTQLWDSCELERVAETTVAVGARKVLETLNERGFSIGIVTRGCHAYAVRALETTGLLQFVDLILGRDDTVNPKPDPEPLLYAMSILNVKRDEVVMVGDSVEDSECARLAGVRFIGVKGGAFSIDSRKSEVGTVDLRSIVSIFE